MKICALCKGMARLYCDSDQANLCWSCDAQVHSANFLVARHSRRLLCHGCQSPTPWSASGSNLGSTVSSCERCSRGGDRGGVEAGDECEDDNGEEDQEEEEDEEMEAEEEEEEADLDDVQVVPWSSAAPHPPPADTSSSSDDSFSDLDHRDSRRRSSSPPAAHKNGIDLNEEISTARPAKLQRTDATRTDATRTGRVERSDARFSLTVDALAFALP
ncbi:unnamed protein product [Cuscuta campestris]|uniref:B box-type domain-containing protein n=1 Tax=Cuscuta campestris TaxID=132261 RepID=A0A484M371_9ASTE|nr:unnamed protein product [Cuscuta campestris]